MKKKLQNNYPQFFNKKIKSLQNSLFHVSWVGGAHFRFTAPHSLIQVQCSSGGRSLATWISFDRPENRTRYLTQDSTFKPDPSNYGHFAVFFVCVFCCSQSPLCLLSAQDSGLIQTPSTI